MAINTRYMTITATAIMIISFVFYIVSNAVPIWTKIAFSGGQATMGLWKICGSLYGESTCIALECESGTYKTGFCSKIQAARAFVTLACSLSGVATICLTLCVLMKDKATGILFPAVKGFVLACFVMGLIGVIIGIVALYSDLKVPQLELGAAAIIGIIAFILNLCAVIPTVLIN